MVHGKTSATPTHYNDDLTQRWRWFGGDYERTHTRRCRGWRASIANHKASIPSSHHLPSSKTRAVPRKLVMACSSSTSPSDQGIHRLKTLRPLPHQDDDARHVVAADTRGPFRVVRQAGVHHLLAHPRKRHLAHSRAHEVDTLHTVGGWETQERGVDGCRRAVQAQRGRSGGRVGEAK